MEQIIAFILGFAATHLQGTIFKNKDWSDKTRIRIRFMLSMLISIAAGCLIHIQDFLDKDGFDIDMLLGNIGVVFTTSQTYYQMYFRHSN